MNRDRAQTKDALCLPCFALCPFKSPDQRSLRAKMRDQGDSIFRRGGKCLAFGAT